MAESYRRHALIEAPIEKVWPVVSDPRTHPDWWPDVIEVRASEEPTEGEEYWRASRRMGFLDQVDGIWVVERLEHLKEAHFRCTVSGSYIRFALTPAQNQTFVEIEAGMLPPNLRWRLAKTLQQVLLRSVAARGARRSSSGCAPECHAAGQVTNFGIRVQPACSGWDGTYSRGRSEPADVRRGPCSTQGRAKEEAARANEQHGGPGFFVEDRDGTVVSEPHAYFAEQSSSGEWYAVLKEMPSTPIALL